MLFIGNPYFFCICLIKEKLLVWSTYIHFLWPLPFLCVFWDIYYIYYLLKYAQKGYFKRPNIVFDVRIVILTLTNMKVYYSLTYPCVPVPGQPPGSVVVWGLKVKLSWPLVSLNKEEYYKLLKCYLNGNILVFLDFLPPNLDLDIL